MLVNIKEYVLNVWFYKVKLCEFNGRLWCNVCFIYNGFYGWLC